MDILNESPCEIIKFLKEFKNNQGICAHSENIFSEEEIIKIIKKKPTFEELITIMELEPFTPNIETIILICSNIDYDFKKLKIIKNFADLITNYHVPKIVSLFKENHSKFDAILLILKGNVIIDIFENLLKQLISDEKNNNKINDDYYQEKLINICKSSFKIEDIERLLSLPTSDSNKERIVKRLLKHFYNLDIPRIISFLRGNYTKSKIIQKILKGNISITLFESICAQLNSHPSTNDRQNDDYHKLELFKNCEIIDAPKHIIRIAKVFSIEYYGTLVFDILVEKLDIPQLHEVFDFFKCESFRVNVIKRILSFHFSVELFKSLCIKLDSDYDILELISEYRNEFKSEDVSGILDIFKWDYYREKAREIFIEIGYHVPNIVVPNNNSISNLSNIDYISNIVVSNDNISNLRNINYIPNVVIPSKSVICNKREDILALTENEECLICTKNKKCVVFNCGHKQTCVECSETLVNTTKKCIICKSDITFSTYVFE